MNQTSQESVNSVINVDELLTRCMGNVDIAERILAKFQERCGTDVSDLEHAFSDHDVETFTRTAHRIKGSSANVAAHKIFEISSELEKLGRANRLTETAGAIEQLRAEWNQFSGSVSSLDLSQYPPR